MAPLDPLVQERVNSIPPSSPPLTSTDQACKGCHTRKPLSDFLTRENSTERAKTCKKCIARKAKGRAEKAAARDAELPIIDLDQFLAVIREDGLSGGELEARVSLTEFTLKDADEGAKLIASKVSKASGYNFV